MKRIFIVISAIVFFLSVPAILLTKVKVPSQKETITVTGTIQCNEVIPISRALVYLVGHSYIAITDDWGDFTIHSVLPGEYLLEVKYGDGIIFSEPEILEDAPEVDLGVLDLNCGECSTDTDCPENQICESSECQPCACPDVWEPVCGVDGTTYDNSCYARCAHIEIAYEGECAECSIDGTACNDGDQCTESDVCTGGVCSGASLNCNDQDQCTTDSCDAAIGCVNIASIDGTSCNDGDACTESDVCTDGACVGGVPLDCDDANPCTDDGCDAASGCYSTSNTAHCDDVKDCTTADTCTDGVCVGTPIEQCGVECIDCTDCNGQACNDGVCGGCSTSADCCAPLLCIGGACVIN